jgi:uncharacterized protein (TIGR02284 family)
VDDQKLVKNLGSLAQLDIDAVFAYSQAIDGIDVPSVREQLVSFRSDHERHISDLSAIIRRHGGEPPEHARDFKGFLIEGFTAIRSMTGTEGALKAMQSNEQTTNKKYSEAMSWEVPADVRSLIQRNFDDEKRHLRAIEQMLSQKSWQQASSQKRRVIEL